MTLDEHSSSQRCHSNCQRSQQARRSPAPLLAERETQYQCCESNAQQSCTCWIEPPLPTAHTLGEQMPRRDKQEDAYRHIDKKDPAPGQVLRNNAANSGTNADSQCYHNAVHAQRSPTLLGRKDTCDHSNIDGKDERASQPLEKARSNQHSQCRRCAAES